MVRRLLIALLTLCLALPAAAMPLMHAHQSQAPAMAMPMAMSEHHHHRMPTAPQHDAQAMPHDCIGCIASYASGAALPGPQRPTIQRQRPALVPALIASIAGPETPPPKA